MNIAQIKKDLNSVYKCILGVVIWTVDDLMNYDKGDAQEWNWLMHTMMVDGEHNKGTDMSMACKYSCNNFSYLLGGPEVYILTTCNKSEKLKLFIILTNVLFLIFQ